MEDVHAWVNMVLGTWGASDEITKLATDSVLAKKIDGKSLLASASGGAERIRDDFSLPEIDRTGPSDASTTDDRDPVIARHARYLVDALSAKVLCNAAMHGWQAEAVFSCTDLVSWAKQTLCGNATKTGTAEHAVCGVLEDMKMGSARVSMLLPGDAADLIPFERRSNGSEINNALSNVWSCARNLAMSGDASRLLDAHAQVLKPCVCVCVCGVCVCVCVCVWVWCVRVCVRVYASIWMHVCMHACMHVCTKTHKHTNTCSLGF